MPRSPILLLDDHEGDRTLIRQALLPAAPRRPVVDFADIAASMSWLREQVRLKPSWPGTILLDWRLDPGDGAEVLAVVRSTPALAEAEVIVLSGCSSPSEQQHALDSGADAWETKPKDWRGYEQLARRLALGRGRFKNPCGSREGATPGLGLPALHAPVGLAAMPAVSPLVTPHVLAAQIEAAARKNEPLDALFRKMMAFFSSVYSQTVDREQAEIKWVCDQHRVRVHLATGHSRDQTVEVKRAAVMRDLIRLGWDDPTLMDCFQCSKATLERRRAEVRESGEGVVRAA